MSASVRLPGHGTMLPALRSEEFGDNRLEPAYRRPVAQSWRQRWERPLTWWSVIGLCSGFWYGVLHFAGVV